MFYWGWTPDNGPHRPNPIENDRCIRPCRLPKRLWSQLGWKPRSASRSDGFWKYIDWHFTLKADSANCCSGSHNTPDTCPPSGELLNINSFYKALNFVCFYSNAGVSFYSYFKSNCPNAYAYAYDESSGTALWTCDSTKKADYTLTFCPWSFFRVQVTCWIQPEIYPCF